MPPLGQLLAFEAIGAMLCVFVGATHGGVAPWIWGAALVGVLLYVLRGWALSGIGPYGLVDLLRAPFYVAWKMTLRFWRRGQGAKEWIRTTREV